MEIVCPDCGQTFRAKNEAGETQGECPSCSATADVPSSPSDPADEGRAAAVSAVPPGAYTLNDARTLWAGLVDSNAPPQMSIKTGRTHASAKAAERLLLRSRKVEQIPSEEGTPPDSDYELTGILGRGGMGVVYSARQASLDRDTAVKMILPEAAQDPDAVNKFLAEAMVLAELDHPNIPPVYDMGGREDGTLFYTMKQVRGVSWDEAIRRNSVEENLRIFVAVCDAVAYAHERGVIHRDLKPENVMLGDYGEILVMDWGLAASVGRDVGQGTGRQN